ncbi:energy-coupling factor ABC transporter ATP-binding protein [Streptomonospora nanhaiensis]|uniref:Biotin transport system ATP-binding protein n=1 Tax=Streptomonospora nanhaiensis TaxID=1323731 RepID=A0A853BJH8_9ACTN|nr:ABC transporter ATP-binding protein [Streptomonospora nanhaiensis]MBV2363271.1 energy-coupling factor ABC transporter ATP-binding protein [Streptomonospora nanhaiensis]MBX9389897.1 energy-coupling factor ABC transporter ATP-binding protein [Streptomonospora nanhaiensis]NYI95629.1 biotin transport system ATP-binding protein [Streptomonospora nanhaiensis]
MTLRLEGVGHAYAGRPVLRDITLELAEHRIGIIGANGSGKSTLARTLNGLVVPDSGRVLLDGLDTRRHAREIRRRVGFVFSDPAAQIVMPTVAEDVAIGLRRSGLSGAEIDARVAAVLERHGLAGHRDHPAHLLSGGQRQMLALASVLVTEPEVLVCDEPTTLLDLRNTAVIEDTLRALPQQVVLLTHHLDSLADFDRVLVMDEGRVVFDGAPADAAAHYTALMRAGAAAAAPEEGRPEARP